MQRESYLQNHVYFFVLFADSDLRVPLIRTVRFVGSARRSDGTEVLMFKDADPDGDKEKIVFDPKEAPEVVLDGDRLLARLARCFAGTLATSSSDGGGRG
jgi:hypothetical protein